MADALAVHPSVNTVNGLHPLDISQNGVQLHADSVDNGALSSAPDSPAILSPPTNASSPPVKIDLDYAQRESDARHEPLSVSLGKADDTSVRAQIDTPADPGMINLLISHHHPCLTRMALASADSIPIAPPSGTPPPPAGQLLEDVRMAEEATSTSSGESPVAELNGGRAVNGVNGAKEGEANGINGHAHIAAADDMNVDTPVASMSRQSGSQDTETGDTSQPPPAKRARKLSDAEQASLAHVSIHRTCCAFHWRTNLVAFEVARSSATNDDCKLVFCSLSHSLSSSRTESDFEPRSISVLHLDRT